MRVDDNDVLITTLAIQEWGMPRTFMREMNPDANPGGAVRVGAEDTIDMGGLIDALEQHLQPLEVRLEYATHSMLAQVRIAVWLRWPEAERYVATHRQGALGELVGDLVRRSHAFLDTIQTMRALE